MSGIELLIVIGLRYNGLKIEADSANLQLIYIYTFTQSWSSLEAADLGYKTIYADLTETF
jgi:hypothetical protein